MTEASNELSTQGMESVWVTGGDKPIEKCQQVIDAGDTDVPDAETVGPNSKQRKSIDSSHMNRFFTTYKVLVSALGCVR